MSARTYVIGLPVVVTVHDDGRVEYDVDTSDAGVEVRRIDETEYDDATVDRDADLVDAAHKGTPGLVEGTPEHEAAYGEPDLVVGQTYTLDELHTMLGDTNSDGTPRDDDSRIWY